MTNDELTLLKEEAIAKGTRYSSPEDQFIILRALLEVATEIALRLPEKEFR